MEELWCDAREFPNYAISNLGRVYSWKTKTLLKPRPSGWGYLQVIFYENRRAYTKSIYRMVAEAFVPGWDEGLEPNHIDGDKSNNIETNLEWVTKGENNKHAIDLGLRQPRGYPVEIIDTGEVFRSVKACAQHLHGTEAGILYVLKGRSQSGLYKGHKVRYIQKGGRL